MVPSELTAPSRLAAQAVGAATLFVLPAPLLMKQCYLVATGVSLAFVFTWIPQWTTWVLLVAMALYDIAAVLIPGGPLRVLVEMAQEREEEIPALVYQARAVVSAAEGLSLGSTCIWLGADCGSRRSCSGARAAARRARRGRAARKVRRVLGTLRLGISQFDTPFSVCYSGAAAALARGAASGSRRCRGAAPGAGPRVGGAARRRQQRQELAG